MLTYALFHARAWEWDLNSLVNRELSNNGHIYVEMDIISWKSNSYTLSFVQCFTFSVSGSAWKSEESGKKCKLFVHGQIISMELFAQLQTVLLCIIKGILIV